MTRMPARALPRSSTVLKAMVLAAVVYLFVRAWLEFYSVAWGSGESVGEFSVNWAALLLAFSLVALLALTGMFLALWQPAALPRVFAWVGVPRARLGPWRWILVAVLVAAPVWLLQCTTWGIVFGGLYVRLVLWMLAAAVVAMLLARGGHAVEWSSWLAALILMGAAFSIGEAFSGVTSYPFSMGWSEGNRLWDYSVLFGRHLYDYPDGQPIDVLLDYGRQLIGGIPFLIPGVSILQVRFWLALTVSLPYVLLGLAAFRSSGLGRGAWLLASLWAMLFLKQGPIHPPLIFIAAFTALLWRRPFWVAIPLVALLSYLAEESRFTWMFAPGIWLAMLELGGASLTDNRIGKEDWTRAVSLAAAGAAGAYLGPRLIALLFGVTPVGASLTPAAVAGEVSVQPLLWYRLLPNATYGSGILVGLLVAIAPLALFLLYLAISRRWTPNVWQTLALSSPLAAFLAVGLIVSTKIGGGGDLHNMDMLLIGLLIVAAVAVRGGGASWLKDPAAMPLWVRLVLVILVVVPALQPLRGLRTIQPVEDLQRLRRLTDSEPTRTWDTLPPDDRVAKVLAAIQSEVELARQAGEVLFLDQRQLLTFGEVPDVPLVPEYEKKVLMNDALTGDPRLFEDFYSDLGRQRFALIVSEPLRAPVKDSSYRFGEENNAWAKWVVRPVLCYYEPKATFRDFQIELLVPVATPEDCSSAMPPGQP